MPGWAPNRYRITEPARQKWHGASRSLIRSVDPPPSCNQLGLSVTTLGVFLRKHFIADVCSDAQTKALIGPGWNDLV
jgi:hypothetical protein